MQIKVGSNENQAIYTNFQTQEKAAAEGSQNGEKLQRKTIIFAGDLPLHKDSITLRRQQAQKKAKELVQNAWDVDRKTDQSIAKYEALAEEQKKEILVNRDRILECRDRKENLREGYGVEKDSQEQKDLELLERRYYPNNGEFADVDFTKEERERLKELEGGPLTEYQQRCLEIDGEEQIFKIREGRAESALGAYNGAVRSIKQERLKSHEMTDAQNNAKKVMEEAGRIFRGCSGKKPRIRWTKPTRRLARRKKRRRKRRKPRRRRLSSARSRKS